MRKLCPFDGGYLKTTLDIKPYLEALQRQRKTTDCR